jgi:hypothetical protein
MVKDIWNPDAKQVPTLVKGKGKQRGQLVVNSLNATVKPHDVVAYRLIAEK